MSFLLSGRGKGVENAGTSLHLQLQTSQDGNTEVNFLGHNRLGACHLHLLQIDKV